MASNDESLVITKVFKDIESLLVFLSRNPLSQFSVSQQECNGAWKLSFPKSIYPRREKHVEPNPTQ